MSAASPMTRAAALDRLAAFLAGPGADYAETRNTDRGRGRTPTTSTLSPYLRRRLITEEEVAHAAVRAYGEREAEKFVSEVFWRTYFKGHLETHPGAWTGYLAGVAAGRERLDAEPGLQRTYEAAVEGRTGIDGYDEWAIRVEGRCNHHRPAHNLLARACRGASGRPPASGVPGWVCTRRR